MCAGIIPSIISEREKLVLATFFWMGYPLEGQLVQLLRLKTDVPLATQNIPVSLTSKYRII